MANKNTTEHTEDALGEPFIQAKGAWLWFFTVLVASIAFTFVLSETDRWMYHTGAEVVDYDSHRENVLAHTTLGSSQTDPRGSGGLASAVSKLESRQAELID